MFQESPKYRKKPPELQGSQFFVNNIKSVPRKITGGYVLKTGKQKQ